MSNLGGRISLPSCKENATGLVINGSGKSDLLGVGWKQQQEPQGDRKCRGQEATQRAPGWAPASNHRKPQVQGLRSRCSQPASWSRHQQHQALPAVHTPSPKPILPCFSYHYHAGQSFSVSLAGVSSRGSPLPYLHTQNIPGLSPWTSPHHSPSLADLICAARTICRLMTLRFVRLDLSPSSRLVPNCRLSSFAWVSDQHLTLNMSQTDHYLLVFYPNPTPPLFFISVDGKTILPTAYLKIILELPSLFISLYLAKPIGQLLSLSRRQLLLTTTSLPSPYQHPSLCIWTIKITSQLVSKFPPFLQGAPRELGVGADSLFPCLNLLRISSLAQLKFLLDLSSTVHHILFLFLALKIPVISALLSTTGVNTLQHQGQPAVS